ncbi:MAG: CDP-alcohol phosphatidyltransferase family protein [Rhodobacteraceae bacterium]|nr:CDP-alcohol phosphatidyltransferase family protein [Paracoccaceae bacterium]
MIDARLLPLQRRLLAPSARWLATQGVGADMVTLAGVALGVAVVPALALGLPMVALALLAFNRLADGLDGAIAREVGPTDRGAFLDIALDFVVYALVPLGFALADPRANALPAVVLIVAFVGTGSSFLAFAAIAGRRGMTTEAYPTKGLYYLGGLTEGAETFAIFSLMCIAPGAFPALAYLFGAACALTTFSRWTQGWKAFAPEVPDRSPAPQPAE